MQSLQQQPEQGIVPQLVNYHFSENHLPSASYTITMQLVLFFLGLGGLNYVPVAYENGSTDQIKVINAVTTAVFGWMVLYISGVIYYNAKIQPQYVDQRLKHIIQAPLTYNAFVKEVATQMFWALLSSVPLATTLFSADISLFKAYPVLFWAAFMYILVVNAVMHLIPIELTMNDPFYGFFPQLLARSCQSMLGCGQSSSERCPAKELLDARNLIVLEMKGVFSGRDKFFDDLRQLSELELEQKLSGYKMDPRSMLRELSLYTSTVPPLGLYEEKIIRFLGALMMFIACLGYAASPYVVLRADFKLSPWEASAVVALPIYFFMLLMVFFGDNIGVRCWKDVLALSRVLSGRAAFNHKSPIIARLYPKTFFCTELLMLFSLVFSGAAAREMLKLAFADYFPVFIMIPVKGVADIMLGLLARYVFLDVVKIMLTYWAQYIDQHPIILLKTQLECFMKDLDRLSPEHIEELKEYIELLTTSEGRSVPDPVLAESSFSCFCCLKKAGFQREDSYRQSLL